MSKIICEVCGTSYPDTAAQCPICGYVNPASSEAVESNSAAERQSGYHYDKGGHFSKSNVRKRTQSKQPSVHNTTTERIASQDNKPVRRGQGSGNGGNRDSGDSDKNKSTALIITTVVLLLAIVGVVIYLSIRFFGPDSSIDVVLPTETAATVLPSESEETTLAAKPSEIPCESISLNVAAVNFEKTGSSRMIYAQPTPADSTDDISFMSSDETVATVSQTGMITAVGSGKATITVTCGSAVTTCEVSCELPDDTTEETEKETEEIEETEEKSDSKLSLNRKDMTFSHKGETWNLYDGSIGKSKITWSSDNSGIVSFEGGVAKAVGKGTTKVHAEYNGEKVSCTVRCNFSDDSAIEGNGGNVSEDGGGKAPDATKPQDSGSNVTYSIRSAVGPLQGNSCTISVGESLGFILKDSNGNTVDATWSVSGDSCKVSGSTVTGVKGGGTSTVLSASYNGRTYTCTVYVR